MSMSIKLDWQKSSFSTQNNNCIELASTPGGFAYLRESDEKGTILCTTQPRLRALIGQVKAQGIT